jgi:lysophospholipase L1-like esterase
MQITPTLRIVGSTIVALLCGLGSSAVVAQPTPPFDTSPAAIAARAAFYGVPGRANLTAANSPLTAGKRIDFFGDSITWLNGYVSKIQTAINTGAGTSGKGIVCVNHGDDGAGALQVLSGDPGTTNGYGSVTPKSFAATISADHPNIAVVFIGVNDVWWRGTSPATFQQALLDIDAQGKAAGITMVLATLAVNGEIPDGTNPNDATYDQFAQITRDVAASTGDTLVDLRKAFIYYEMNNNPLLPGRGPGGFTYKNTGILTYDGIHPSDLGNNLLADQIAQGIFNALVPEPGTLGLVAIMGCVALFWRRRAT